MADEKPLADLVVGDRFWLGYAQEMVKAAIEAPDRRAEQLANGIVWFWTVYSAVALVVWTTRGQSLPPVATALLVLPTILLIVAYWLASRVRKPIGFMFDPRVPSEIEAVHRHAALSKSRALAVAEVVTGLAAACVVASIVVAAMTQAPEKADLHPYIARGSNKLLVLGTFPRDALVHVTVRVPSTATTPAAEVSQLAQASGSGELRAGMTVPISDTYRVIATWNEDKVERSLSVPLERPN